MKCNECKKSSKHLASTCNWVAICNLIGTSKVIGACAGDGENMCNCSDQQEPIWDCDLGQDNPYCNCNTESVS